MIRLVARAATASTIRRRPRRPFYRYSLAPLESFFSVRSVGDEFDHQHEQSVARRVFGFGFLVLVATMIGLAIVLKQLVHAIVGVIG